MEEAVKVKICGMMRDADIEAVNALLPDYIGFVFAENRRRRISPETAARFRRMLNPRIQAVGVFLNQSDEEILHIAERGTIDLLQLHGEETDETIRRLHAQTGLPVIKAFRVETAADADAAMRSPADYVLLDHGAGGTGERFDWSLLEHAMSDRCNQAASEHALSDRPFFLAGGLHAGNVAEAVERLRPFAVDVSSGVETDGRKDRDKIAAFLRAARANDRHRDGTG